jgi:hypothetical protein
MGNVMYLYVTVPQRAALALDFSLTVAYETDGANISRSI